MAGYEENRSSMALLLTGCVLQVAGHAIERERPAFAEWPRRLLARCLTASRTALLRA